jgi:hypothetical protein
VAEVAQRRAGVGSRGAVGSLGTQSRDEVGAAGLGAEQLALESRRRQVIGEGLLGGALDMGAPPMLAERNT